MAWAKTVTRSDLFLSVVTLGEIQSGVEITRGQNSAKALEIEAWLDQVMEAYNVLPMDARAFRLWAKLMHGQPNALNQDAMIAATAQANGLIVVTRNVRDFAGLGVELFDPFGYGE